MKPAATRVTESKIVPSPMKQEEMQVMEKSKPNLAATASISTAPVQVEEPLLDTAIVENSIKKVEEDVKEKINALTPQLISIVGLAKYRSHQLAANGALIYILISGIILFARSDFFNVLPLSLI